MCSESHRKLAQNWKLATSPVIPQIWDLSRNFHPWPLPLQQKPFICHLPQIKFYSQGNSLVLRSPAAASASIPSCPSGVSLCLHLGLDIQGLTMQHISQGIGRECSFKWERSCISYYHTHYVVKYLQHDKIIPSTHQSLGDLLIIKHF